MNLNKLNFFSSFIITCTENSDLETKIKAQETAKTNKIKYVGRGKRNLMKIAKIQPNVIIIGKKQNRYYGPLKNFKFKIQKDNKIITTEEE